MKKNGGFTLVELIVVIAIIAVLAAITVPAVGSYLEGARRTAVHADVLQLAAALNTHNAVARNELDGESLLNMDVAELERMLFGEGLAPSLNGRIEDAVKLVKFGEGRIFEPDVDAIGLFIE